MKNKAMNRILSFALTVALLLCVFAALPMTAYAVEMGTKDNMVSGSVVVGTNGNPAPTQIGFGGRLWDVIGYDGTGIYSEAGTMTLLFSSGQGASSTAFDSSTPYYSNHYDGSVHKAEMETDFGILLINGSNLTREGELVLPRNLEGGSTNQGVIGYDNDKISGNTVNDAYFWPLSVNEANALDNSVRAFTPYGLGVDWWLRSPGNTNNSAAVVYADGSVHATGLHVSNPYAIRPAFKLNLSSVILTSDAAGGKSGVTVGGGFLESVPQAPTGAIKLTVLDSAQILNVYGLTGGAGTNMLTFSYDAATVTTGSDQYISCVLENISGAQYYGKLEDLTSGSGSGALNIDFTSVTDGTYTLKLFNEQAKGDYETDFASMPVVFTINVTSGNATIIYATSSSGGSYTPTYTSRTLTDAPSGVKVTANMDSGTRLNVTTNTLHAKGCKACDEIRSRQQAGGVLALYDIALNGYHKGVYEVFIPFSGSGGYYTVLHCNKGVLEKQSGPYSGGGVSTTWAKLSPFAVVSGAENGVPDYTVTDPPKTGSAGSIWGYVMMIVGLIGFVSLRVARRRNSVG